MDTLGRRVQEALDVAGLTVHDAARNLGCSREAILQWISGQTKNIKNELLFAFADLTGHEPRWIATGKGPKRPSPYVLDPKICRVVAAMQQMPEYRKEDLVKISDTLAEPRRDSANGTEG